MNKKRILISSCLLGIPCRYDGQSKSYSGIEKLTDRFELVPFCPECYGGLPTPRNPAEIQSYDGSIRVITNQGKDVTREYVSGAESALELCKQLNISLALLKAKSPSCGRDRVYDGTFSSNLKNGDGITAGLLQKNNIRVYTEMEIDTLIKNEVAL